MFQQVENSRDLTIYTLAPLLNNSLVDIVTS